jgi:hypothetical protein
MSINWGQPSTANATSNVSIAAVRAQGNTSPATSGMVLQSISFWADSLNQSNKEVRYALYQGGTLGDIKNATLIEDLGNANIPTSSSPAWLTINSTTNPTIPSTTLIWVVVAMGGGGSVRLHYSTSSADAGDFQTARGNFRVEEDTPVATVLSSGFPASIGTTVSFSTAAYLPMYLTYSVSGGGPAFRSYYITG